MTSKTQGSNSIITADQIPHYDRSNVDPRHFVTDIVKIDYRTSQVFSKYGIDYCCMGKQPLETVCQLRGLDTAIVIGELEKAMRGRRIPGGVDPSAWSVDFLIDYVVNIHHTYQQNALPLLKINLAKLASTHSRNFPYAAELVAIFRSLEKEVLANITEENEVIFPYIKQLMHAYESKEPYAALLVRTLRKPINNVVKREEKIINTYVTNIRNITSGYDLPAGACSTHRVTFSYLRELDDDLTDHLYLENNVLFPRTFQIESQLLASS
jgi:regulator of cell morphogenesis and NO signaling